MTVRTDAESTGLLFSLSTCAFRLQLVHEPLCMWILTLSVLSTPQTLTPLQCVLMFV